MVPVAYGTQTGGSVLRPASYCGCVGYKPTFNLINRQGICFAAETLDTIGLLTRTVDDAELITAVLVNKPPAYLQARLRRPGSGSAARRCGTPPTTPTKHAVEDAAKRLAAAGASVKEIVLPEEFEKLYYTARETINNYERSKSMAADWQHHPDKISKVLGDRVKKGFAMKHEDYVAALQLADRCRARIDDAYDGIDAIISPCVKGEALEGLELHRRAGVPAVLDGAERPGDVAADPHRAAGPAGRHPAGRAALPRRPPVRLRALGDGEAGVRLRPDAASW